MDAQEPKQVLDKLQTAERQIDTAIWLWFHEADIVSIIQLVDAAMSVLDDLLFHHERLRPLPFTPDLMQAVGKTPREVRPQITSAADFAKHARNDPEEIYEYDPVFAENYLFTAILAHDKLTGDSFANAQNPLREIFAQWYRFARLGIYDSGLTPYDDSGESLDVNLIKNLSRLDILKKAGGGRLVGRPPVYL